MTLNPFAKTFTTWTVENWLVPQWNTQRVELHMETKTFRVPDEYGDEYDDDYWKYEDS